MAQTVIGFFEKASDAQRAIERLESMGMSRQDIVISNNGAGASGVSAERDPGNRNNGISGFFNSIFGNNSSEADRHARLGNTGLTMVTVHAQTREQAERAADLLDECGAVDIDEKAARVVPVSSGNNIRTPNITYGRDQDQSIQRIQETLEVGKRTVEHGGVRIRSRIIERPVEERIRLREERIHVERNPVNRPVSASELNIFQEGNIELTERAEVPVVNKQARVVEEIRVSKDVTERNEVIQDTVRKTEVDIDRMNAKENTQSRKDSDLHGPRTL